LIVRLHSSQKNGRVLLWNIKNENRTWGILCYAADADAEFVLDASVVAFQKNPSKSE